MSPSVIQHGMLQFAKEIGEMVEREGLQGRFGDELESVTSAIRDVALSDPDAARQKLLEILDSQLRPLYQRIRQAIKLPPVVQGDKRDPVIDFFEKEGSRP
jgi:hypothetical protein